MKFSSGELDPYVPMLIGSLNSSGDYLTFGIVY